MAIWCSCGDTVATRAPDYALVPSDRLDEFVEVEARRRELSGRYEELAPSERDELSMLDSRDSIDLSVYVCANCGRIFIDGRDASDSVVYGPQGEPRLTPRSDR